MGKLEMFEERWNRILACTNTTKDSELAKVLEILPQSVSAARKRQQIPTGWVEKLSEQYRISADWIFFGRGPMRPFWEEEEKKPFLTAVNQSISGCARCRELEDECRQERHERREVSAENRQLHNEVKQLLRENSELKAELADLKS